MENQYKIEENKEKDNKINKIVFIAALPPIMSAISIDELGDGARIKLDISRKYLKEIIELQLLAGQSFRVIIEPTKEDNYKYER